MNKKELKEILSENIWTVLFTKKSDGSIRNMRCTLIPEYLPEKEQQEEGKYLHLPARKENPNVIAVWDLDKNGWRSFAIDTLISIEKSDEE